MSVTVLDLLTAAAAELNIVQAGEVLSGEDAALALLLWNELIDTMNSEGSGPFTTLFVTYTLTPNLQPHTIGISANSPTFAMPTPADGGSGIGARPQEIMGANLILTTSTPNNYKPLTIRDQDWWLNRRTPGLTSSIPLDLFYSPDWPNGSIYLWPVPTTAYGIQLQVSNIFGQMTYADTFTLPPGYQQMCRLWLAELMADAFGVPMPPTLPQRAADARSRVYTSNVFIPRIATATSGLSGGGGRTYWDYRTGETS